MKKAKVLSLVLGAALVAAGLLAAVALAWPSAQPRALHEQGPKPAHVQAQEPAEPLPLGGPTESALNFAQ